MQTTTKRRLSISLAAALVYAAVYVGLLTWRGEAVDVLEIIVGAAAFFIVFFSLRTWLDRRRHSQAQANETTE